MLTTNQNRRYFIKIEVINKRVNQGDHQIKVIGKILDYATEDEVDKYFGSIILVFRLPSITLALFLAVFLDQVL